MSLRHPDQNPYRHFTTRQRVDQAVQTIEEMAARAARRFGNSASLPRPLLIQSQNSNVPLTRDADGNGKSPIKDLKVEMGLPQRFNAKPSRRISIETTAKGGFE
jgi:hypothetical protein